MSDRSKQNRRGRRQTSAGDSRENVTRTSHTEVVTRELSESGARDALAILDENTILSAGIDPTDKPTSGERLTARETRQSQPVTPALEAPSSAEAPPTLEDFVDSEPPSSRAESLEVRDTINSPEITERIAAGSEQPRRIESRLSSSSTIPDEDAGRHAEYLLTSRIASDDDVIGDPLIGMVIADRYQLVDMLGRGGMGIVYRVEHTRIGKLMAMKLLAGELSTNKEVVSRFKREALTVSKLSSPYTVQVFDYGVWQHLTYLVMELVEGMDLARVLRREGPMPFARLGRLMVMVCSSLAEAHGKGIVHRDIKPENIMVIHEPTSERGGRDDAVEQRGATSSAEVAKVCDFGLAKLRESSELNEQTLQGAVIGTPYYMSPEQVLGEEVDGRTDIYALGAVMFRALTGSYPFNAGTPMGMFTKHLTAPPPAACDRAPRLNIPRGVSDLVSRCMAKSKGDRFQNVEELRDALLEQLGALGLPSVERLLLASSWPEGIRPPLPKGEEEQRRDRLAATQFATRDEVQAYERKLRRARYSAWGFLSLLFLGAAGGGAWYLLRPRAQEFTGWESEPNNTAASANQIPMDTEVRAYLGQRIEPATGDRDFYSFQIPPDGDGAQQYITINASALPNIPTCSLLYRLGYQRPLAQYCTGRAGQDLQVSPLRIESGGYLLVVMQDMSSYDHPDKPFIHENVSDPYTIEVSVTQPREDSEIEPNDQIQSAQRLSSGGLITATLGWMGDEDVFCAESREGAIRWHVTDGQRIAGTILVATPITDNDTGPSVRIHKHSAQPFDRPRQEADVNSPWASPSYEPSGADRCLLVRLAQDPWARGHTKIEPDGTKYTVRLEQ